MRINAGPGRFPYSKAMTQDLLKRYGGAVPRYTSYPTAPHFSDAVTEADYRDRLSRLPSSEPVSLYLHVPYCDTLCWFCGCHTKITRVYKPVQNYVDTAIVELRLLADAAGNRLKLGHLHWGGGSPTLMRPEEILRLAEATRRVFPHAPGFEFAVEIDPRETGPDRIAALAESGLTRASIGIQDFDPEVQKAINRVQSYEETARTVQDLRRFGVHALNLDLMYGLPYQTQERTLETIRKALWLRPGRGALFGYAHVPWMKTHMRMIPEEALPGPEERLETAEAAAELLVSAGYRRIGLDHFALPEDSLSVAQDNGTLRRNFQGYTTDQADTLLAVGASGIGRLPDMFVQNQPSLQTYARQVADGVLPIAKGVILSADDRLRAAVIERLMCDFAVDLNMLIASHGASADCLRDADAMLTQMEDDGLLTRSHGTLTLTEEGRPYVRQVAACFDSYFRGGAARHSSAV